MIETKPGTDRKAREAESVPAGSERGPLLAVRDLARYFDVSRPWLNRMLEGSGRRARCRSRL